MHLVPSGRSGNTHKDKWLRNLFEDGEQLPIIFALRECQSEVEVLAQEIVLTALFRQASFRLTNLTEGGEGSLGHVTSEEQKEKIRASLLGHKHSPETRAKMMGRSSWNKGGKASPEARSRMSSAQLERFRLRPFSSVARAKQSVALKAVWEKRKSLTKRAV